jgi:hypothetical protein
MHDAAITAEERAPEALTGKLRPHVGEPRRDIRPGRHPDAAAGQQADQVDAEFRIEGSGAELAAPHHLGEKARRDARLRRRLQPRVDEIKLDAFERRLQRLGIAGRQAVAARGRRAVKHE